jgi:hypothetical protein
MKNECLILIIIFLFWVCFNSKEHLDLGGIKPIYDKCRSFNGLKKKYYARNANGRKKFILWNGQFDPQTNLMTSMGGKGVLLPRDVYCSKFKNDPECYA